MSDWDFLWDLEGDELKDSMSSGASSWEWDLIAEREEKEAKKLNVRNEWNELKILRDTGKISKEEFKKRKMNIFPKK